MKWRGGETETGAVLHRTTKEVSLGMAVKHRHDGNKEASHKISDVKDGSRLWGKTQTLRFISQLVVGAAQDVCGWNPVSKGSVS